MHLKVVDTQKQYFKGIPLFLYAVREVGVSGGINEKVPGQVRTWPEGNGRDIFIDDWLSLLGNKP